MLTATAGRRWLDRWDRQQELYIADREERFQVIADVVEAASDRADPLIVDLGAGPGSLSARLLRRLPGASVVAIDADPLLLGLARAGYAAVPGLRLVERDLRMPGWAQELDLPRPADAVVSTTALHWLTLDELAAVYAEAASLLAPGGVLVNGDHLAEPVGRERIDHLARIVRDGRAARVGVLQNESWQAWWAAVAEADELAPLVAGRAPRPVNHSVPEPPTVADHITLLGAAGFSEVGSVWQHGDDRVLIATGAGTRSAELTAGVRQN